MIAALWLIAVGLAGGVAHFALLRWNTCSFLSSCRRRACHSRRRLAHAIALQVLRLALLAALLRLRRLDGALPLLLAALGILMARPLVLRAMAGRAMTSPLVHACRSSISARCRSPRRCVATWAIMAAAGRRVAG